eukprot:scaffold191693_cov30-Prasinocladus_malaysianus.AAC.1
MSIEAVACRQFSLPPWQTLSINSSVAYRIYSYRLNIMGAVVTQQERQLKLGVGLRLDMQPSSLPFHHAVEGYISLEAVSTPVEKVVQSPVGTLDGMSAGRMPPSSSKLG